MGAASSVDTMRYVSQRHITVPDSEPSSVENAFITTEFENVLPDLTKLYNACTQFENVQQLRTILDEIVLRCAGRTEHADTDPIDRLWVGAIAQLKHAIAHAECEAAPLPPAALLIPEDETDEFADVEQYLTLKLRFASSLIKSHIHPVESCRQRRERCVVFSKYDKEIPPTDTLPQLYVDPDIIEAEAEADEENSRIDPVWRAVHD